MCPVSGSFCPPSSKARTPKSSAIGDEHPSDESPWWLFYQLSQAVLAGLPARTDPIRARWAEIQEELFDSAYEIAEQGRRLLDQGDSETASIALTAYMAENTDTMLRTVREMLAWFPESEVVQTEPVAT